jgi:hypothetical protein
MAGPGYMKYKSRGSFRAVAEVYLGRLRRDTVRVVRFWALSPILCLEVNGEAG